LGVFHSVLQLERFIGGIGKGLWTDGTGEDKQKRKKKEKKIQLALWQYCGIFFLFFFFSFFDIHRFHQIFID